MHYWSTCPPTKFLMATILYTQAAFPALRPLALEPIQWDVHQSTSDWALTALDCSLAEVTAPAPVNAYGETKLRFEEEIRAGWDNHLILRSSLIYGPPPPRECARSGSFLQFLDEALGDPAKDQAPLDLFADEVPSPPVVPKIKCNLPATSLCMLRPRDWVETGALPGAGR